MERIEGQQGLGRVRRPRDDVGVLNRLVAHALDGGLRSDFENGELLAVEEVNPWIVDVRRDNCDHRGIGRDRGRPQVARLLEGQVAEGVHLPCLHIDVRELALWVDKPDRGAVTRRRELRGIAVLTNAGGSASKEAGADGVRVRQVHDTHGAISG